MPNAWASFATGTPRRPSPTTPRVLPCSPGPIRCCQPPARTAASSRAKLRVSAMIIPIVSSGIALPEPVVPQTATPRCFAASRSIDALAMPVVTSSRRFGRAAITRAGNGVRSRMATTTSLPARRRINSSSSARCWLLTSTVNCARTADQSALARATPW